jgi:hypothetical protein
MKSTLPPRQRPAESLVASGLGLKPAFFWAWISRNTEITDVTDVGGPRCPVRSFLRRPGAIAVAAAFALVPLCVAFVFRNSLPAWIWMWLVAFALYFAAKWTTLIQFLRSGGRVGPRRLLTYTLLWPGMDAPAFCGGEPASPTTCREWVFATVKTGLGAAILWLGTRLPGAAHPLIAGWIGMVGIVLLLHFGMFHLLSLIWRWRGYNASPIMQAPLMSTSLSRFWGGNWNTAFSDLMRLNLFKPLVPLIGPRGPILVIFLFSGILHELVISLPARGGYGLPTAYFTLQGLGLFLERSRPGRRVGLGSGWRGWCFVALISGFPAFWLFPPVFIHHVILPMLRAIGAN